MLDECDCAKCSADDLLIPANKAPPPPGLMYWSDTVMRRAAVEAGYASLPAYVADHSPQQGIKPMNIYVAGPMRGIPEFNFPAFHAAAAKLRLDGHTVFNPAEKDKERLGVDISKGNATGCEITAAKDHGFNLRVALGDDLDYICREADAIALLPGWEKSKGATAEHATAVALGLKVIQL